MRFLEIRIAVIDSKNLERDFSEKPVPIFSRPALELALDPGSDSG